MDTVTVLRIELADGRGPFSTPAFGNAMNAAMGDRGGDWHEELPTSHEAFGALPAGLACGTETARDLVRWFPAAMRDVLAEYDFGVSAYRVPAGSVRRAPGAMQVMFDPAAGTRVHHPIADRLERRLSRLRRREEAKRAWGICPAPAAA